MDLAAAVGAGVYSWSCSWPFCWRRGRLRLAADSGRGRRIVATRPATPDGRHALLLACLGGIWARHLRSCTGPMTPQAACRPYTALALVAGTTVGLSGCYFPAGECSSPPSRCGSRWPAVDRAGYLPDLMAGLKLRADKVAHVWLDGAPWQVEGVGLLQARVGRAGECNRVHNQPARSCVSGAAGRGRPPLTSSLGKS